MKLKIFIHFIFIGIFLSISSLEAKNFEILKKVEYQKSLNIDISNILKELSSDFKNYSTFISTYNNMNNKEFIEYIYKNILDKLEDTKDINHWIQYLNNGKSRLEMTFNFIKTFLNLNLTSQNFPNLTDRELEIAKERQNLIKNKAKIILKFITLLNTDNNKEDNSTYKFLRNIIDNNKTVLSAINFLEDIEDNNSSIKKFIREEESKNQIPNANAGEDKSVTINNSIILYGSGTDSDGNIISYEWKKGSEILGTDAILNYTPTKIGRDTLTLIVTDNDGATNSDNVIITVLKPKNKIPIANAGEDKSVTINNSIILYGSGTDSDGNIISYEWKKGSEILGTDAILNYIPTKIGRDTLTLTVTDNDGATNSDNVIITVLKPKNQIPNANAEKKSVLLFIDEKFYTYLIEELETLKNDIKNDISSNLIIQKINTEETTPEEIRSIIKFHYKNNGLIGSIFVGDIPLAQLTNFPYLENKTIKFYEDLDDKNWIDINLDGIYDMDFFYKKRKIWLNRNYIAETKSEVWSGWLIPPKKDFNFFERVLMLKKYFLKDHNYRIKKLQYKKGLIYFSSIGQNHHDIPYNASYLSKKVHKIFETSLLWDKKDYLNIIQDNNIEKQINLWKKSIKEHYEYAYINVHGSAISQWFGENFSLYSDDYISNPSNVFLMDISGCNNGKFYTDNYLGGSILFGGDTLIVIANPNTKIVSDNKIYKQDKYKLLAYGLTIGDVFRIYDNVNSTSYILGDPTLKLRIRKKVSNEINLDKTKIILPTESILNYSLEEYQNYYKIFHDNLSYQENEEDFPQGLKGSFTISNNSNHKIIIKNNGEFNNSLYGYAVTPNYTFYTKVADKTKNHLFNIHTTIEIEAGEKRVLNVYLFPDKMNKPFISAGKHRIVLKFMTDSPSLPYFYISIEKTFLGDNYLIPEKYRNNYNKNIENIN